MEMKRNLLFISVVLVLSLAVLWGCGPLGITSVSQEESLKLAQDFLVNAPTYKYDGMDGSIKFISSAPMAEAGSWEFVFQFTSTYSGYGERTGQILLQVLTPHTAKMQVVYGKVTSAVLDGKWNELNQKPL